MPSTDLSHDAIGLLDAVQCPVLASPYALAIRCPVLTQRMRLQEARCQSMTVFEGERERERGERERESGGALSIGADQVWLSAYQHATLCPGAAGRGTCRRCTLYFRPIYALSGTKIAYYPTFYYALAMRCPVLIRGISLGSVRVCGYEAGGRRKVCDQVDSAIGLRARYAMSGTDIAYDGTSEQELWPEEGQDVREQELVLLHLLRKELERGGGSILAIVLHFCYAIP
eukprot:3584134-Rhodomonas_salina.1